MKANNLCDYGWESGLKAMGYIDISSAQWHAHRHWIRMGSHWRSSRCLDYLQDNDLIGDSHLDGFLGYTQTRFTKSYWWNFNRN